jgi:hypothetical protein
MGWLQYVFENSRWIPFSFAHEHGNIHGFA